MTTQTPLLFSWSDVESLPDIERLRRVLDALPDEALIAALERRRGKGRNDYPLEAMWRALVAGIVFQHPSIEALLRELNRNPALLDACGFHPVPLRGKRRLRQDPQTGVIHVIAGKERSSIPSSYNVSRFVVSLLRVEEEEGLLSQMLVDLRHRLMDLIPDFGVHLGCDGKAIASQSTGVVNATTGTTSDRDADWGKHETRGVSADGKAWTKVKTWFGYTLHLIADTTYEIPVAAALTKASASEVKTLEGMLPEMFEESPDLATRCKDMSADRGYDSGPLKKTLWETWQIRPIIDVRMMWRNEKAEPGHDPKKRISRPLDAGKTDTMVYTERGEVRCICPEPNGIWPSRASRRREELSSTAARRQLMASTARDGRSVRRPVSAMLRIRPYRPCAPRPRPPDLHPDTPQFTHLGPLATGDGPHSRESMAVLIRASASSTTRSAASAR